MTTATLPAPTTAPAKKGGLKRLAFAKPAKKESSKTSYPVFDDPNAEQVTAIAARIRERQDQIEALTGAQETDKAELKMFVAPFYFTVNRGKAEPPSSISVPSEKGEVLVTFQNRYKKITDEAPIAQVIGQENLETYFRACFSLTIKGEELPADKAQDIVDAIQAVLQEHHALGALDIKEEVKPTSDFHIRRHSLFTPDVNVQLEQVCPIVAMVKTKGREEK